VISDANGGLGDEMVKSFAGLREGARGGAKIPNDNPAIIADDSNIKWKDARGCA